MTTQLNYNQVIQGFPSYRVFIGGFEVTSDCTDMGSVWVNGRVPSFIDLTLLNLNDKYIIRKDDMIGLYPAEIERYVNTSTGAQSDLATLYNAIVKGGQIPVDSFFDKNSTKAQIIQYKQNDVFFITANPLDPFTGTLNPDPTTGEPQGSELFPIYPFIEGKSVFHQNDQVRVFVQDPFDPQVWYYGFAGFITKITDGVIGANLEKTLTISCEDVSKVLRYARYTTNPGIRDPNLLDTSQDFIKFSGFSTPTSNLSLQEAADFVVFGEVVKPVEGPLTAAAASGAAGTTTAPVSGMFVPIPVFDRNAGTTFNRTVLKTAAGNFKPLPLAQRVYTLTASPTPGRSTTTLENWQNNILNNTVQLDDLTTLRARSENPNPVNKLILALQKNAASAQTALDFTASLTWQIMTAIGTDIANYPVDGGTLYMLLPEGLSALGSDVIAKDYVGMINQVSEFKDRRTLMYDLCDRVEFCFYADPKGNLIIEFPLFDFQPSDFVSTNQSNNKKGDADATLNAVKFTQVDKAGHVTFDNARRFTIEDEVVENFDAVDDDAHVATIAIVVPAVAIGATAAFGNTIAAPVRNPVAVRLDTLIPIYGPRVLQGNPSKPVETERAALISGAIELNKYNSEAYTYKIPMLPRFSAWLNRPMLFKHRNHIATVYSITHRISWANSISTTIAFRYARGWTGDISQDSNQLIYEPVGGLSSRPLNYALMFAHQSSANSNSPTSIPGANHP